MRELRGISAKVTPLMGKGVVETAIIEVDGVKITVKCTITPPKKVAQGELLGDPPDVALVGTVERTASDGTRETIALGDRELRLLVSCMSRLRASGMAGSFAGIVVPDENGMR